MVRWREHQTCTTWWAKGGWRARVEQRMEKKKKPERKQLQRRDIDSGPKHTHTQKEWYWASLVYLMHGTTLSVCWKRTHTRTRTRALDLAHLRTHFILQCAIHTQSCFQYTLTLCCFDIFLIARAFFFRSCIDCVFLYSESLDVRWWVKIWNQFSFVILYKLNSKNLSCVQRQF